MSGNPVIPRWSPETERNALGLAMLAYPVPTWLQADHFFSVEHQFIFRAAREAGSLPGAAALLRSQGDLRVLCNNGIASADLAEMCLEADHARRMGWPLPWDELRELADQRRLLDAMQRVTIELRGGQCSHAEALVKLGMQGRGVK
jgi:hypothetical protein